MKSIPYENLEWSDYGRLHGLSVFFFWIAFVLISAGLNALVLWLIVLLVRAIS